MSSHARRWLWIPLILLSSSFASAATIDADLQSEFLSKTAGETLPVMILLEDRLDVLDLQADLKGLSPRDRTRAVVDRLRDHASRSQSAILADLSASLQKGEIRDLRILWTINAISFEMEESVLPVLTASKTAALVVHDRRYDMLDAVQSLPEGIGGDDFELQPAAVDTSWGVQWINATRVWLDTGYDGDGVLVAHLDSGAAMDHPDLVNRFWVNPGEIAGNLIDDDGNGYVDDVNGYDFANEDSDPEDDAPSNESGGHGTHTAGTVAGDGSGGTITGVAPGASLMICKVFATEGDGAAFSDLYQAQQYAIENGARILTVSLGLPGAVPEWLMRIEREQGDVLRAAGLILFNSAGNYHVEYDPPEELGVTARVPAPWNPIPTPYSSLGGVVAVGGTAYKSNLVYSASSWGPADWSAVSPWNDWPALTKPDIAAPGEGINSTTRNGNYSGDTWSGTSMSCPHLAGVAALMLQKNPSLSPSALDSLIETTAQDLGSAGKDNTFGSGLVNALAAVNATPTAYLPHVALGNVTALDAGGDGILDPDESIELVIQLINNSPVSDATSVSAGLGSGGDPLVTVTDASAIYADLPMGGGSDENSGDVFSIYIDAAAAQGHVIVLPITVYAAGGYEKTLDVSLSVGLPEFLTHDVGAVYLTVTDQAILGFMDDSQAFGSGFGLTGQTSPLFLGSFWGGNGLSYICNRDYSGGGGEVYEWVVSGDPNGRVFTLSEPVADQEFQSIFSDAGASSPQQIRVTQHSYAWAEAGYDEFVLLRYHVIKTGGATVSDWHAGIFCDWDVGTGANVGGNDATRKLMYINESGGQYFGVAFLGDDAVANLSLIHNPTYVYPNGFIDDGIKSRHLKGVMSTPSTTTVDDWSAVTSVGPYTMTTETELDLPFVMTYGNDLAHLQANVDAALEKWGLLQGTAVDQPIAQPLNLQQNVPNPFNPSTTISFSLDREGPVQLRIYDTAGRLVNTLVDGNYPQGSWSAQWDGRDENGKKMSSGVYFYQLNTAREILGRKMILVK